MKKSFRSLLLACFAVATTTNLSAQTTPILDPLISFGTNYQVGHFDGTIWPGEPTDWSLDSSANQRGMAYDPLTGNLVLVNTGTGGGGGAPAGAIYVLDGTYGTNLHTLDMSTILAIGNYADTEAVVADDGVVYVCNAQNQSTNGMIIYRWDSTLSTNPPLIAFSNSIAPSQRYGISLKVRGGGTNTQMIMGSYAGTSGTNVVVFTTADGTNFTATVLGTDVTTANFSKGIAWGVGDTFWTKSVGTPLRLMSFDLAAQRATTIKAYDLTTDLPGGGNLEPLALDITNKVLAAIQVNIGTEPEQIWLYDITDTLATTNAAPKLLSIKTNTYAASSNPFAPYGVAEFGGGRLYSLIMDNGLAAFNVATAPMPAPTIVLQPATTNRVFIGQSVTLSTFGYPAVTYQWQKNGTNLLNATNQFLTFSSAVLADSGIYRCVLSNASLQSVTTTDSGLNVSPLSSLYHLNQLWSVAPGSAEYMITSTGGAGVPNQRTIAYNSLSNELYIVARAGSSGQNASNYTVYAIPATNVSPSPPAVLKTLNTNGITMTSAINLWLCGISVAADGAIYACNVPLTASSTEFRLYRWLNSDPDTVPATVYAGDAGGGGGRWGDNMDVRGQGLGTQVLVDDQSVRNNGQVAMLTPVDSSMSSFSRVINNTTVDEGNTSIGHTLLWGPGQYDYYVKRRGANMFRLTFNGGGGNSTLNATCSSFPGPQTPAGVTMVVAVDWTRNLAYTVRSNSIPMANAHSLEMWDVTDLTAPNFITSYQFPAPANRNDNFISQIIVKGDYIFALAANSGIMGFKIASGPPTGPVVTTQPQDLRVLEGSNGSMSVAVDQGGVAYQWQKNGTNLAGATASTYNITNALASDTGDYRVIATNFFGAATSHVATVTVVPATGVYTLSPVWSNAPGTVAYLTPGTSGSPNERWLGYNSVSNQLMLAQRDSSTGSVYTVHVIDANSGGRLYTLPTDGIVTNVFTTQINGQSIVGLVALWGAEDGAIYGSSESPAAWGDSPFDPTKAMYVYRWANSSPASYPSNIFVGDPASQSSNFRWGDTLIARGTGANTELLMDNQTGQWGAILKPIDSTMSAFTNYYWSPSGDAGSLGRSLQWAGPDSIWQKHRGVDLNLTTYDTNTHTGTLTTNYPSSSTLGGVTIDPVHNLLVGVDFTGSSSSPDTVALYDISVPNTPMLIARYNFPINHAANQNYFGNVVLAGNRAYAFNANNGIVAFDIVAPNVARPTLTVVLSGANAIVSWPATYSGLVLQTSPTVSPPAWSDVGPGTVVGDKYIVTNSIGGSKAFYSLRQGP